MSTRPLQRWRSYKLWWSGSDKGLASGETVETARKRLPGTTWKPTNLEFRFFNESNLPSYPFFLLQSAFSVPTYDSWPPQQHHSFFIFYFSPPELCVLTASSSLKVVRPTGRERASLWESIFFRLLYGETLAAGGGEKGPKSYCFDESESFSWYSSECHLQLSGNLVLVCLSTNLTHGHA